MTFDAEIAKEQAMINARISREKDNKAYMKLQMMQEAAARVPTTQVGLLSRPPVTYTAEGIPMQTPPLNRPPSAPIQNNSTTIRDFPVDNQNNSITIGGFPVDNSDLDDPDNVTKAELPYTVKNPYLVAQGNQSRTMSLLGGPVAGTATPKKSTGPAMEGFRIGNDQGDAIRSKEEQLGFMDKIFSNPMLQRLMERSLYSQPTFGGNFISEQASGERGLRSMEAQSAELAQKKAMENNKIQATLRAAELKAGKGVKPDGTLATLTRSYFKSSQGVDLLTQMKNLTTEGAAGGPLAVSENALNAIFTSFGGNPEESTAAKLGVLRAQLMDSFTFTGKDISEADKKIIDELLPPTGGLTLSKKQFTFALNKLLAKLSNEKTFSGNSIRTDYGRNPDQYTRREAKPKLTVTGSRQVPK